MSSPTLFFFHHGIAVFVFAGIAALALGWLVERWLRRRAVDARWRARTEGLRVVREPREGRGVVEGVLRADAPLSGFDGAPCVVATAAAGPGREHDAGSTTIRAERAWLETSFGPVGLSGPLAVVSGPHRAGLSTDARARVLELADESAAWAYDSLPVHTRVARDGERVQIAGTLHPRTSDRPGGYRETASGWTLASAAEPAVARVLARARAWRGPVVALAIWLVTVAALPAAVDAPWAALVSPVQRSGEVARLRRILGSPYDALRPEDATLRVELFEPHEHAARARLWRAAGEYEAALAEAERGEDRASGREQVLALLALRRDGQAIGRWIDLVEEVDAVCRGSEGCLAALSTLHDLTPSSSGGSGADTDAVGVYLSSAGLAHDPGLMARMTEMLEASDLHSPHLQRLRVEWLLERARFDLLLDHSAGARVVLLRADRWLRDSRVATPTRARLHRAAEHLLYVSYLRERDWHLAAATLRSHPRHDLCPLRDLQALVFEPTRSIELTSVPLDVSVQIREATLRGITPRFDRRPAATDFRAAVIYARHLDEDDRERLRQRFRVDGCSRGWSARDLVEVSARAAALDALGDTSMASRLRACVNAEREHLLGLGLLAQR